MPQLRDLCATAKIPSDARRIPQATTKTQCNQINKRLKKKVSENQKGVMPGQVERSRVELIGLYQEGPCADR